VHIAFGVVPQEAVVEQLLNVALQRLDSCRLALKVVVPTLQLLDASHLLHNLGLLLRVSASLLLDLGLATPPTR
jgi:hypothetical protein